MACHSALCLGLPCHREANDYIIPSPKLPLKRNKTFTPAEEYLVCLLLIITTDETDILRPLKLVIVRIFSNTA